MIAESIAIWSKLASDAEEFAAYEEARGSSGAVYRNKAETYRRTVRALELERETGIAHCVCCLRPYNPRTCPANG